MEKNQVITFKSDGIISGEQALREIVASLNQSAGGGTAAQVRVGSPVFDSNGRLVRVEIVPPSASNETQIAEALQNAGLAEVQACFPQLILTDLNPSTPDGIVIGGGFPALAASPRQTIFVSLEGGMGGALGTLDSDGFNDFAALPAGTILLQFSMSPGAADLVIPQGATVTLNTLGGITHIYTFDQKGLTLIASPSLFTLSSFWLDDQGNLIARQIVQGGTGGTPDPGGGGPILAYLDACQDPLRAF